MKIRTLIVELVAIITVTTFILTSHFIWFERIEEVDKLGIRELDHPSFVISGNGRHFSYCVSAGKSYVVIDGVKGPLLDSIMQDTPVFSSDGDSCYYVGNIKGKAILFKNNLKMFEDQKISGTIRIGRDGNSYLCTSENHGHQRVVLNGVVIDTFDQVIFTSFLGSKQIPTYIGRVNGKYFLVHGLRKYGPFYEIRTPVSDASGGVIAFEAIDRSGEVAQIDDRKITGFDSINEIEISPNGKHFFVVGKFIGKYKIVFDNGISKKYDLLRKPGFLNDGTPYYLARNKGCGSVFLGNLQSTCYDSISDFTAMKNTVAYSGHLGNTSFICLFSANGEIRLGAYANIDYMFTDLTQTRLFLSFHDDNGSFVLVDGRMYGPFANIMDPNFTLKGDSIFSVKEPGFLEVYLNGKKWKKISNGTDIGSGAEGHIFSIVDDPDSKEECLWMDGWLGHPFERIIRNSIHNCDSKGGICYYGFKDGRLYKAKFLRLQEFILDF